jgi:hypothetical protein
MASPALKITRHSIQCVPGLPNRGKRIAAPDKHKQKEALSNLKQKLGTETGIDVKVQDLIKWIKKGETDDFSVRSFHDSVRQAPLYQGRLTTSLEKRLH